MRTQNTAPNFDNLVTVQLTCLEQQLDSKADVKERILDAFNAEIEARSQVPTQVEELPIGILQMLHDKLGICFEIKDAKIIGVFTEVAITN